MLERGIYENKTEECSSDGVARFLSTDEVSQKQDRCTVDTYDLSVKLCMRQDMVSNIVEDTFILIL